MVLHRSTIPFLRRPKTANSRQGVAEVFPHRRFGGSSRGGLGFLPRLRSLILGHAERRASNYSVWLWKRTSRLLQERHEVEKPLDRWSCHPETKGPCAQRIDIPRPRSAYQFGTLELHLYSSIQESKNRE